MLALGGERGAGKGSSLGTRHTAAANDDGIAGNRPASASPCLQHICRPILGGGGGDQTVSQPWCRRDQRHAIS